MTDQERIENLEKENHALRETAREWKNACEREIAINARMKKQVEEPRRQKRKRCLAMAEWCDAEADVADADGDYEDMRWYQKWHERWLEIADKFKEE